MTEKPATGKGNEIMRALFDLVVLVLLIGAAGGGGYWYGVNQRLAPVLSVGPGTPGALPPPLSATVPKVPPVTATPTPTATTTAAVSTATTAETKPPAAKTKYWISSSGSDYMGSSITVKVNGAPVDSFFGPGKNVDITSKVKPGDNTLVFESKALGADYNQHAGDASAVLTLQIVTGPYIQENFKSSDVLATFKRSATDSEDAADTMHFTGG